MDNFIPHFPYDYQSTLELISLSMLVKRWCQSTKESFCSEKKKDSYHFFQNIVFMHFETFGTYKCFVGETKLSSKTKLSYFWKNKTKYVIIDDYYAFRNMLWLFKVNIIHQIERFVFFLFKILIYFKTSVQWTLLLLLSAQHLIVNNWYFFNTCPLLKTLSIDSVAQKALFKACV